MALLADVRRRVRARRSPRSTRVRKAFAAALVELAARDDRVVLLTGDLGYTVLEPFAERFPDRFVNVGVAEQNMVGIATGLAEAGFVPFCYSIATFGVAAPVRVHPQRPGRCTACRCGSSASAAASTTATTALTHYALEDVGRHARPAADDGARAGRRRPDARPPSRPRADLTGPVYLRLGKARPGRPGPRRALPARPRRARSATGRDVALVALGGAARRRSQAAELLAGGRHRRDRRGRLELQPLAGRRPRRRCSPACRSRSRSRRTTSTAASARSSPRSIAEAGLDCRLVRCGVRVDAARASRAAASSCRSSTASRRPATRPRPSLAALGRPA